MKKVYCCCLLVALGLSSHANAEISGTYTTTCSGTDGVSAIRRLNFSGFVLNDTQTVYGDTYCGSQTFDISMSGSYQLNTFTKDLDYHISTVKIRPLSVEIAEYLNSEYFCGFDDWNAFAAKIVTGHSCGDMNVASSGSTIYNKIREIKADDFSAIQLGLTDYTHDGSRPSSRPIKFNPQFFFPL